MERDRDLLHNSFLLDEWQQGLKSKGQYRQALDHSIALCPELALCIENQVTTILGDWPTWFYTKKLVAQVRVLKYS